MKKYLFDKVLIKGSSVTFVTFRQASFIEYSCFTYAGDGSVGRGDRWNFNATSFKECLNMLKKTKLSNSGEYDISVLLQPNYTEPIDFDQFLKVFTEREYSVKAPNEKVISDFYNKAYQIREEARRDKEILEREPSSYLDSRTSEQGSTEPEAERE